MIDELIRKLDNALREAPENEKQVVFITSKIRKILERENIKKDFPVLNFYANWSLHAEIEKTSAINLLLKKITGTIIDNDYDPSIALEMVNFDEFRKELGDFLDKFKIHNPVKETKYWRNLRPLLLETLSDCPLKPTGQEMTEFCFLKSEKNEANFKINFKKHLPISGGFIFINH